MENLLLSNNQDGRQKTEDRGRKAEGRNKQDRFFTLALTPALIFWRWTEDGIQLFGLRILFSMIFETASPAEFTCSLL